MNLCEDKATIDVSLVIISWRMKEMLRELLRSVVNMTTGITYEVIVIDNDSRDGTAEMISAEFPHFILVRNTENRGVAPARNQGFRISRGRYVVTLDADMVLREDSLKKLADFMDANPCVGLAGCKLTTSAGEVQLNAKRYPTPWVLPLRRLSGWKWAKNSRALRYHEISDWDRSDTREVDYVTGACQFIRKSAMDEVGYLDEGIFYGPEDLDYCIRMRRGGWKVFFLAEASIIHYEQRATKRNVFSRLALIHLLGVVYLFWKYKGNLSRAARDNGRGEL